MLKHDLKETVQESVKLRIEKIAREHADAAQLRYPDEGYRITEAVPVETTFDSLWDEYKYYGTRRIYYDAYRKRIERRLRTEEIV